MCFYVLILRSVCCCCLLQTYEMNKNVRMAWVQPVDDQFLRPVDFTEIVGKIKVCESPSAVDVIGT